MSEYELESFQIILHSGNARSSAYEALACVKKNEIEKGNVLIKEARDEIILAQKEHAKLLRQFTEKIIIPDLLLVHAEDHVSSSQIAVDLIQEMIEMYGRFEKHD